MIRFIVIILTVITAAGCSGHKLAECRGPLFPLNAGQWQPQPTDLAKE